MRTISLMLVIISIVQTAVLAQDFQASDQKALDIVKKIEYSSVGFGKYAVQMNMELHMANGKSYKRVIKSYVMEHPGDYERTISVFNSPADVKGAKLLSHSHAKETDDQWIFLPSLNKTKRIANENKSGSFMGSELAFEDLGNSKIIKYQYKFLGEEKVGDKNCLVIQGMPVSKFSGYSQVDMYVDKANYTVIQSNYFDKKKELLKTESSEFKLFNNRTWLVTKVTYKNVKNGKSTIINWTNFDFKPQIDANNFSSEKLAGFNGF